MIINGIYGGDDLRKKLDQELVYETALSFFAKYGYKKTTLDDIASALNMKNTAIYSYASSKQALYHECIAYAINVWQEHVRQAVTGIEDAEVKLLTAFDAAASFIESSDVTRQLLKNDPTIFPMFPEIDPIEEFNEWSVGFIRDIVKQGIDDGKFTSVDPDEAALVLFNLYKYFIIETYSKDGNPLDVKKLKNTISIIFMNGLLK